MAQFQNQDPQNAYNYEVNFTTTNLSNGDPFVEPHTVSGPTPVGAINIPLNAIVSGSKAFIPLTSASGNGAYYLKLHFPQPGSSKMYVTFAMRHTGYNDGYYDFIQGIPDDYRAAFKEFCRDGNLISINNTTPQIKKMKFVVKGIDTNNVSASVEYQVWLRYIPSGIVIDSNEANENK